MLCFVLCLQALQQQLINKHNSQSLVEINHCCWCTSTDVLALKGAVEVLALLNFTGLLS